MTIMNNVMTTTLAIHCREKGVRLAQTMRAGPRIGPWEYSYKRLKLAQIMDKLGVILTPVMGCGRASLRSVAWAILMPVTLKYTHLLSESVRPRRPPGPVAGDGDRRPEAVGIRGNPQG